MTEEPTAVAPVVVEMLRKSVVADDIEIFQIANDERAPIQSVERAFSANALRAGRLIRLANFAPGLSQRVGTMAQVISIFGLDYLVPLSIALSSFGLPARPTKDNSLDERNFLGYLRGLWEHALGSAAMAGKLAGRAEGIKPVQAFAAGFIHDIGRVLLLRHFKQNFLTAFRNTVEHGVPVSDAERSECGLDHITVGEQWCRNFEFSRALREAVKVHHSVIGAGADPAEKPMALGVIVQAAEMICEVNGVGVGGESFETADAALSLFGLTTDGVREMVDSVNQDIVSSRETFGFLRQEVRRSPLLRRVHAGGSGGGALAHDAAVAGRRGQVIPFPKANRPEIALASEPKKMVILVVEDHGTLCDMVSLFFMRNGYHVRTANNGEAALDALAREEIHLVLLDLMLPRIDGFEVLRQINKASQEALPYIIAVSAGGSDKDRRKVIDLGANEFMPKPFHLIRLLERVQAVEKYLQ